MPKKARKYVFRVIGILFLLFILVINVQIPVRINTTALEINLDDPYHMVERTIEIRGWYRINVFSSTNRFNGRISIDGTDYMNSRMPSVRFVNARMASLELRRNRATVLTHRSGIIMYRFEREDGRPDGEVFASIFTGRLFFRNTILRFHQDNRHGFAANTVIMLGANSREEIVDRFERMNTFVLR